MHDLCIPQTSEICMVYTPLSYCQKLTWSAPSQTGTISAKTTLASVTKQILGFDPSPDPNIISDLSKFNVARKGKG